MLFFVITYLIMSFYIPSLKIGIITTARNYFIIDFKSMYLFKIIIPFVISFTLTSIYNVLIKKQKNILDNNFYIYCDYNNWHFKNV